MTRNASAGADAGIGAGGRKAPRTKSLRTSETAEQIAAREAKEAAEEKGRRLRAAARRRGRGNRENRTRG